jgi:hypothetical protein
VRHCAHTYPSIGICEASQSDTYLTSAVECARDKCDGKALDIGALLLAPAQLYCGEVGNKIPDDIISSAYLCATGGTAPTTTQKPSHAASTTKKQSEQPFETTVTTTFTQMITDDDGHTFQVAVPIIMGPSTVGTGAAVTSTVKSSAAASSSASSVSVSPSQTAKATSASATKPQAAPSSSDTATPTQRVPNSNGSPFENMQGASASQWSFSGPAVALGLIAGVFMRL